MGREVAPGSLGKTTTSDIAIVDASLMLALDNMFTLTTGAADPDLVTATRDQRDVAELEPHPRLGAVNSI